MRGGTLPLRGGSSAYAPVVLFRPSDGPAPGPMRQQASGASIEPTNQELEEAYDNGWYRHFERETGEAA